MSITFKSKQQFGTGILFVFLCVAVVIGQAQTKKKPTSTPSTPKKEEQSTTSTKVLDSLHVLMESSPFYSRLYAVAKSKGDSVVLRYAPTKSGPWKAYNAIGYVVERKDISDSNRNEAFVRLTSAPLKPWTLEEWKAKSAKEDSYAAIAAQCLYGRVTPMDPTKPAQAIVDAANEFENKFGFALFAADNHPHAANGLGLRYVDASVKEGRTYVYRIFPARPDSIFIIDTAYIVTTVGKADPLPPPANLVAEELEGKVEIKWKNIGTGFYTGFHVYRKGKDGKEVQLTKTPVVPMTFSQAKKPMEPFYTDTTAGYYKQWTYLVRGIDAFADLSEPAIVTAMGRDKTPPPIPALNKPLVVGNKVTLTWEMKKEVSDLAGFIVERSDSITSRYSTLTEKQLPASQTKYLDSNATPDFPYYNVMAVDTAGNMSEQFPMYVELADTLPPSTPKFISAAIDTNGIVTLKWHLGSERDLLGYRVLWANDSTHEFTQRTNLVLQDTVFYDSVSIKTLTHNIYYKVVAVDTRYYHSQPTDIIKLRRPDVLPPETPVFTDVFVTDTSVVLRWAPSTSDDVKEQVLSRRRQGEKEWQPFATLNPRTDGYTDTTVNKLIMYEYSLQAIDSAGLKSPLSSAVQGRPYDAGVRPNVQDVVLTYNDKTNTVSVQWKYPYRIKEKYWFVVYRSFEEFPLRQYRAVESEKTTFTDNDLIGKGRYTYAVRVMSKVGESPMSDVKEITIK
ncbi:MAG: fibronectin type III domain-containing protein [Bacteriodetes bacterium]|nr:fibronectin type III domain-containing protein [Bacteroidota bacterium]